MKNAITCLVALMLFAITAAATAQPKMQAGLWEHSFEMESQSGQIEAAMQQAKQMLQALPPEQRKMIEQQLAAQGINLSLDSFSARVCVSEEQAARNEFPPPNENCSQSVVEQSDKVFKLEFRCEGNPPTEGEGELRMLNDKQYRGKVTINTSINGQPEQVVALQEGNWIGADCGATQ